jgi:hypothetical protein
MIPTLASMTLQIVAGMGPPKLLVCFVALDGQDPLVGSLRLLLAESARVVVRMMLVMQTLVR